LPVTYWRFFPAAEAGITLMLMASNPTAKAVRAVVKNFKFIMSSQRLAVDSHHTG
jgi:hypothetical protein